MYELRSAPYELKRFQVGDTSVCRASAAKKTSTRSSKAPDGINTVKASVCTACTHLSRPLTRCLTGPWAYV